MLARSHGTPQSYTQLVRSGGGPGPRGVAGIGSEGADPWGLHSLQAAPGLNSGSHTWGETGSPPELDFSPRLGVPPWALCTLHPRELPGSPRASLNCHGCFLCTCQVCRIRQNPRSACSCVSPPAWPAPFMSPSSSQSPDSNLHQPHSPSSPPHIQEGVSVCHFSPPPCPSARPHPAHHTPAPDHGDMPHLSAHLSPVSPTLRHQI